MTSKESLPTGSRIARLDAIVAGTSVAGVGVSIVTLAISAGMDTSVAGPIAAAALAAISVGGFMFSRLSAIRGRVTRRQVFVISSHEDRDAAERVIEAIKDAGYASWSVTNESDSTREQVAIAMRHSGAVVFLMPSDGVIGDYLRDELSAAERLSVSPNPKVGAIVPLIPAASPGNWTALPDSLQGLEALDLSDESWRAHLNSRLDKVFEKSAPAH